MGWKNIIIIIVSYLLGCINTGYYYALFFYRQDIRTIGTNVTGAMNVSRLAGKKGFVITFLGDALKGALVVLLCRFLHLEEGITLLSIAMVLVGHIFPLQLKFHGGKGISTIFGALLIYNPILIVYLVVTCVVIYPFVRKFTITSLFALLLFPLEIFITDYSSLLVYFTIVYAIIIIFSCRSNLKEYINARAYLGNGKK